MNTNMQTIVPIILSGGSGSRLWPLSTPGRPKQFHPIFSSESMIAATAKRVSGPLFSAPVIVSGAAHLALVSENLNIKQCRAVVLEPFGRNTAAAVAIAALTVAETQPDSVLMILASDHHIVRDDLFLADVQTAASIAEQGPLVLFGIRATEPHTGYGYIKHGQQLSSPQSYAIDEFIEKPTFSRAQELLEAGGYSWNSGMFMFRADRILQEFERHAPQILQACRAALDAGYRQGNEVYLDPSCFAQVPSQPLDVAIMEHTESGVVLNACFDWSDVGCWAAVHSASEKDSDGNAVEGRCSVSGGTKNTLVRNFTSAPVFVTGLENTIVVVTDDGIVVSAKDQAQDVKKAIDAFMALSMIVESLDLGSVTIAKDIVVPEILRKAS